MAKDVDPRYALVYEEAHRAVAEQQAALDNLRTRAGTLIAASSIATGFLGAGAIGPSGGLGAWAWVALVLFGLSVGAASFALWPRTDWKFRRSPRLLLKDYVEATPPLDMQTMHKCLAKHLEDDWKHNDAKMDGLHTAYSRGLLLLFAEVVAWIIAIARR